MIVDATVGFLLGFAIGAGLFVLLWLWSIITRRASDRVMFPLEVRGTEVAEPSTLEHVLEAARAAALRVTAQHDGFDVLSQPPDPRRDNRVSARVSDPSNVSWATLMLTYDSNYALAFGVVLALVPVLGPATLVIDGNPIHIDGELDVHELTNAHAKFVRAKIRGRFVSGPL